MKLVMFEYQKILDSFTKEMAQKLEENQHKSHWRHNSTDWLFHRLIQEVSELSQEMLLQEQGRSLPDRIAREAADIACFAMMIADNYGGLDIEDSNNES